MSPRDIALLFICTISAFCCADSSPTPNDTVARWTEDIDYLHQQLEQRHMNLYHQISKPEFVATLDRIKQVLPTLSQPGISIELMRLFRKIGDGHTQFAYWGNTHHSFPVEFKVFNNKLHLTGITPNYKQLLGMQLVSINGVATERIAQQLKPLLQSVENPYSEMQRLVETISVAEMLAGIGVITAGATVEFGVEDAHGNRFNAHLSSRDSSKPAKLVRLSPQVPASFVRHNASITGVELLLDTANKTALIRLDSYPRTGMTAFAEKLAGLFAKHNIRNVIIDLRENGGGDFFVGLTLAWGLVLCDQLDWQHGIYTLIGRKTFSAAMSNAVQFRQILNAKLVGEPTGSNPVGYQDADTFQLPNSGWVVMHSKRFYRFQETATQGVQPDVYLAPHLDSFLQGKDAQLEWILADIKQRD